MGRKRGGNAESTRASKPGTRVGIWGAFEALRGLRAQGFRVHGFGMFLFIFFFLGGLQ